MLRATSRSCSAVRLLAFCVGAAATLFLSATSAPAQGLGGNGFGSTPAARPAPVAKQARVSGGLTEFATDENVEAIHVRGNKTVPAVRITGQMQTRVGRPYDPKNTRSGYA